MSNSAHCDPSQFCPRPEIYPLKVWNCRKSDFIKPSHVTYQNEGIDAQKIMAYKILRFDHTWARGTPKRVLILWFSQTRACDTSNDGIDVKIALAYKILKFGHYHGRGTPKRGFILWFLQTQACDISKWRYWWPDLLGSSAYIVTASCAAGQVAKHL